MKEGDKVVDDTGRPGVVVREGRVCRVKFGPDGPFESVAERKLTRISDDEFDRIIYS